jgi:predicted ester cyclase
MYVSDMENVMDHEQMVELVTELGRLKSLQDVRGAVDIQHGDMLLEVPPLNAAVRGKAANEVALTDFFRTFPDYAVAIEGTGRADDCLVAWGRVRMTLSSDRLGVAPTGKAAEFPAFFRFGFADGLIAHEYFLWDLAEACAQWGVSSDAVRARLFSR